MNIGDKIKELRQNQNLTQDDLSKLTGISRITLGNYERGERTPTIDKMYVIAKALNVTIDDFMEYTEEETKSTLQKAKIFFTNSGYKITPIKIRSASDYYNHYKKGYQIEDTTVEHSYLFVVYSDEDLIKIFNDAINRKDYKADIEKAQNTALKNALFNYEAAIHGWGKEDK